MFEVGCADFCSFSVLICSLKLCGFDCFKMISEFPNKDGPTTGTSGRPGTSRSWTWCCLSDWRPRTWIGAKIKHWKWRISYTCCMMMAISRNLHVGLPYSSYDRFQIFGMREDECEVEFLLRKRILSGLLLLCNSKHLQCHNGVVLDNVEGLCFALKRFAYPCNPSFWHAHISALYGFQFCCRPHHWQIWLPSH